MPSFVGGKVTLSLHEDPKFEQSDDELEYWTIRFTGEIFSDYEEYYSRTLLYRQRIWTCSVTGMEGLSYEEAFLSEQRGRTISSKLALPLQKKVLEMTQFSVVTRMDQLCDNIVAYLKENFVEGEEVLYSVSDKKTMLAKIVHSDPKPTSADSMEVDEKEKSEHAPTSSLRYIVQDVKNGSKFEVDGNLLSRRRNAVAKVMIRNLIKESATKENFLGAPWIIREDLAEKFNINTKPPEELWDAEAGTFKRKKKASSKSEDNQVKSPPPPKLPKPKYPIEDTEVSIYSRKAHPEMDTLAVPVPKNEFTIKQEDMPTLLSVWSEIFIYAKPLKLFPFNFDDFENALRKSDLPLSRIMPELHISILKVAGNHTQAMIAKFIKQGVKPKKIMARSYNLGKYRSEEGGFDDANGAGETSEIVGEEDSVQSTGNSTVHLGTLAHNDNEEDEGAELQADLPPEDGEIIKYMDYTYVGSWWNVKISQNNWPQLILKCILHLATIRDLPCLPDVLEHLTDEKPILDSITGRLFTESKSPWLNEDILEKYADLSISQKLEILAFLFRECVIPSPTVRHYMEDCSNQLTEFKREKRELDARKKEMMEEQKEFVKQVMKEEGENGEDVSNEQSKQQPDDMEEDEEYQENEDDYQSDSEDEEEEDSEIKDLREKIQEYDQDFSKVNRQEKVKLQSQLKELEDDYQKRKLEKALALAREKNAAARERSETKRRMDNDLAKLLKRELHLDREMRKVGGCIRLRPLGRDRFWNRYWWFDGYGSGSACVLEYGASGPWSKANTIPYGSGRLWVEGVGMPDYLGLFSGGLGGGSGSSRGRKRKARGIEGTDEVFDPTITMPLGYEGNPPGSHAGNNWLKEGEWRYYDDPEQIDEMLCWLNPKGVRENVLKSNLLKYYDPITHCLKKRNEELQNLLQLEVLQAARTGQRGRPRTVNTADRYMHYTNRWKE